MQRPESHAATTTGSPAAYLASAAWVADARAEQAAKRENFTLAREWRAVAAEIRRVWDLALEAAQPGKAKA